MKVSLKKPKSTRWYHRLLGIDPDKNMEKVRIDDWDTWNCDITVSIILYPLIKRYREKMCERGSFPIIDMNEDVPEFLKIDGEEEEEANKRQMEQWLWILDEVTWALDKHNRFDEMIEDVFEGINNPDETEDKIGKEIDRMDNGMRLFGKYLKHMWW